MATFDVSIFRAQFPEFADSTKYPTALIQMYWNMATQFIAATECPCQSLTGDSLVLALNYMTAQLLTLGLRTSAAGPNGEQGGFETSASIGDISVAKLAPPVKDMWDWWLAQTPYGQALLALLKVKAVGGLMVGGLPERGSFRKVAGVFW